MAKGQKTAGKTAKKSRPLDNIPVGKHELAPGVSLEVSEEKKDRVVLALSTEQATELHGFLGEHVIGLELNKIRERISKTLTKQAVLRAFEKQGVKNPTKEQIKKALEVAK